ncbi:MAG: hypothetical protein PHC53_00875 [Patescibacteria group bacterium]|nr:hypothetical protein [Patescibacteria group bacterium]
MKVYKTKARKFSGSDFHEVNQKASSLYSTIKKRSKRRAYIRSAYFKKDKIFLDLFWSHLFEKQNWRDRVRRIKYFGCAIELINHSRFEPKSKENHNQPSEILHRFYGITADDELFCAQIKEYKKNGQKFLISVFPTDGPTDT